MLAGPKLQSLNELLQSASREELIWISGYIAAFTSVQPPAKETKAKEFVQDASFTIPACTVVYGTETGNSKKVATDFSSRLKKQGVQAKLKSLDQYKANDLSKESCLIVVMSTQGDGDPPEAAKKFYDQIHQNEFSLNHLKYGVFALGDSAYPLFCKAGEDVDSRLYQLGARRITPLKKCDTDFESDANSWIDEFINAALKFDNAASANGTAKTKAPKTGKKVYHGTIAAIVNLNDRGSNKETYHIEIATEEDINYEPGDSLGVVAKNNHTALHKIFELLEIRGEEELIYKEQAYNAVDLFRNKINIQYLPERIVQQYAKLVKKEIPAVKMDLADLLRIYPPEADQKMNVQLLVNILDPIIPRLYSISSSPSSHGEKEIHVTVSRSKFNVGEQVRFGLCSDYLSCLAEGDTLQFYIQRNSSFRLPSSDTDIIMIGPGTGLAPFRSFLFERDAQGHHGHNWLFFGEQHFVTDFFYQTELLSLFDTGVLTKINTAFSRDQKEKIYVQHKMQQHAAELFEWIENGAHIYICGCKDPMSFDVEKTLLNMITTHGNLSESKAEEYLTGLHENGRYHKDVY
jgi:sulfite reductase (NADPH) flavoprotein alpha-component